jgi:predicted alpha/beta hydrolase family esterase
MKNVLIIPGWYQKTTDNWYGLLKNELETKGIKTDIADLLTMNTDLPDMEKELNYIFKTYNIFKDTVIVGHSLGAVLALRIVERKNCDKLFLVAGWDFNDLTEEHRLFWQTTINHEQIKSHVKEIYCISSDNDPYFTAFTAKEMCKRLNGKFILKKGVGHFLTKDGINKVPEIVANI